MKSNDGAVAPVPQGRLPVSPGVAGPTRRRLLQLAGGALVSGVAASVLNACSSPGGSNRASAPAGGAPPTDSPAPDLSAVAPTTQPPTTLGAQVAFVEGTLPIPPLLVPEIQGGPKVFRLALQKGQSQFLDGRTTASWGFNGNYLGPTLRASDGQSVVIHVTNHLGETTTVHWHGMHVPAAMDDGPHQMIDDNATWSPQFTIQQPAATLWYHPHMMGETLRQVGMGLVGLFILDDANSEKVDLPHTYGVDDIPLVLQAKTFGANGQFVLNGGGGGGAQRTTLVNGAILPAINTPNGRLRLRVLNASSQEFYDLGFAGGETFHQVASDSGLLVAPAALTRLQLAPAERAEIVVDVNPARPMVLQGFGGNGGRGGNTFQAGQLLTINPTPAPAGVSPLPAQLATIERLSPGSATQTRDFVLGGNDQNPTINGQSMTSMADMMDMTSAFQVKLGATEIWNLINRSGDTHAFHVHDIQF